VDGGFHQSRSPGQAQHSVCGVGYPETWLDYSAYEVKPDDIFGNIWRGNLFKYHREVGRLGEQVDRRNGRWIRRRSTPSIFHCRMR